DDPLSRDCVGDRANPAENRKSAGQAGREQTKTTIAVCLGQEFSLEVWNARVGARQRPPQGLAPPAASVWIHRRTVGAVQHGTLRVGAFELGIQLDKITEAIMDRAEDHEVELAPVDLVERP